MSLHKVVLLLGSNLGNREAYLQEAIAKIGKHIGEIVILSEIEKSQPVEFVSNNFFCNIAMYILTDFSPVKLLKEIKRIENEMGRVQDSFKVGRYVDRIIDIDIIQFDNIIFESNALEIPHKKHLFEREFSKKLLKNLNEKIKTQI